MRAIYSASYLYLYTGLRKPKERVKFDQLYMSEKVTRMAQLLFKVFAGYTRVIQTPVSNLRLRNCMGPAFDTLMANLLLIMYMHNKELRSVANENTTGMFSMPSAKESINNVGGLTVHVVH